MTWPRTLQTKSSADGCFNARDIGVRSKLDARVRSGGHQTVNNRLRRIGDGKHPAIRFGLQFYPARSEPRRTVSSTLKI